MSACAEAVAGGVVDLLIGVPAPTGEQAEKYQKYLAQLRDRESKEDFTFPAQYMFKDVPEFADLRDPVETLVAEMDLFGIRLGMLNVATNLEARRARQLHPDRFLASWDVDPNRGMEAICELEQAVEQLGVKSVQVFPAGLTPQVPINDKKMYPLYAKCIELDIPIFVNAGVPGPRVPMACQDVALIDEVCWFFPELKFVTRHGCEPWTALAVKLLLKWPNLYYSTSAFAPKYYPKDIVDFANTRGADKVMYAGYFPMGLTLERIFKEMPDVPFRDHVWPKFLRENALRLFGLERLSEPHEHPYEAARAGGTVDTAVGFPKSREDMYEFYEFIRKGSHDRQTKEGGLEFPAGYMFKDVPKWDSEEIDDPVLMLLAILDAHGLTQAIVGVEDEIGKRAVREFPDRFFPSIGIDPNEGMEALRKIDRYANEFDLRAVGAFPAGLYPQVALNDKKFYPVYMKCIELDIAFCSTAGVPGPATAIRTAGRRVHRRGVLVLPGAEVRDAARL